MSRIADGAGFIRANTSLMSPPLVPEVKLHLAHEAVPLWQKTEEELGEMGLPPPFWAFAWAGGQALARHVLDHPGLVMGKRVVDLASGSGLVGLAALKAGAAHVLAADIDGFAVAAIELNAEVNFPPPLRGGWPRSGRVGEVDDELPRGSPPLVPLHSSLAGPVGEDGNTGAVNGLPPPGRDAATLPAEGEGRAIVLDERLSITSADLLASPAPACDIILIGDLFYEKDLAAKVFAWAEEAEQRGIIVLIGDPGRSYLPREKLASLGEYSVPVTRELEDSEIKRTQVWRLARNC